MLDSREIGSCWQYERRRQRRFYKAYGLPKKIFQRQKYPTDRYGTAQPYAALFGLPATKNAPICGGVESSIDAPMRIAGFTDYAPFLWIKYDPKAKKNQEYSY